MMSNYSYSARYVNAYDGDTVTLDVDLGFYIWAKEQKFRLHGIDAPELRGDTKLAGIAARDYLHKRLSEARSLYIQTYKDTKEKYGRWLVDIYVDGDNVNMELLTKGLAKPYMV